MIGHAAQKKFLLDAWKAGNLAQAYSVVGPDSIGKRTLVHELAAELWGVSADKVTHQPNYIAVARLEDEKTGKLKKEISVVQARELKSTLAGSSWGSGPRLVIVDDAELLNAEASNALLKLLEEPPAKTHFFLLTTNDQALLPTIRSRVQSIFLSPITTGEIKNYLDSAGVVGTIAEKATEYSWGRPGRALQYVRDEDIQKWYDAEVKRWQSLQGAPLYQKISLVEKLYGDKDDAVRGREALMDILDLWAMQVRADIGRGATGHIGLVDEFARGKELLAKNVHPRLVMENILLKMR